MCAEQNLKGFYIKSFRNHNILYTILLFTIRNVFIKGVIVLKQRIKGFLYEIDDVTWIALLIFYSKYKYWQYLCSIVIITTIEKLLSSTIITNHNCGKSGVNCTCNNYQYTYINQYTWSYLQMWEPHQHSFLSSKFLL